MSALLERIVASTREDVEARRSEPLPIRPAGPAPGSFSSALARPGLSLIAELKPRSPSRGKLLGPGRLEPVLEAYRRRAHAVSVLVDEAFFGGGLDLLERVRAELDLPLLAKGFLLERRQLEEVHARGADAVLLIARLLDDRALPAMLEVAHALRLDALVEVHGDDELERALGAGARIVGINARDLDTLAIDLSAARALLAKVPQGILRVAESGLETRGDVRLTEGLADACLIGTAFLAADDPEAAIEELGW